jgi:muramoyltetrapeptide carboxypeptidase
MTAVAARQAARIEVIAPSGAHLSVDAFDAAVAALRARGHSVRCDVPREGWQRFSDTDDARLEQVHRAARAKDVDVVMIARGGYGLSRLLDRIDWALVAASATRGVRWVGYSDFTAFQLALLARTGARSFAGPGVSGDFGVATPDTFMLAHFDALVEGRLLPVQWTDAHPAGAPAVAEAIDGTLWGGNLSLVAGLVGTPFLPAVEDGLLFLEDVSEHPYRVERMLHQLLYAGMLSRQRAIVLGAFTDWKPAPHDNGYDLGAVVEYFRSRLPVPILTGLPFGHVPRKAVLAVGERYRLESADAGWRLAPADSAGSARSA